MRRIGYEEIKKVGEKRPGGRLLPTFLGESTSAFPAGRRGGTIEEPTDLPERTPDLYTFTVQGRMIVEQKGYFPAQVFFAEHGTSSGSGLDISYAVR